MAASGACPSSVSTTLPPPRATVALVSQEGLQLEAAQKQLDPLAVRALDLFIAVYSTFSENMARAVRGRGGVVHRGSIAPQNRKPSHEGGFPLRVREQGALQRPAGDGVLGLARMFQELASTVSDKLFL